MLIKKTSIILLVLGFIASCIGGYYLSAFLVSDQKNTIYTIIDRYSIIKETPFANYWNKYSILVIFFVLLAYLIFAVYFIFSKKTTRPGEESGSSMWENPMRVSKRLSDRNNKPNCYNIVVFKKSNNIFMKMFNCIRNLYFKFKYRKAD